MSSTTEAPRRPLWVGIVGWLGAVLWALFLYLQSSSSSAGSFLSVFPDGADKVAHAGAYAMLGALLTLATGRAWLGVLLALAFGVSDEIHQSFVPDRASEVLDVVADGLGALVGASVVAFLSRRARRRPIE